MFSQLDRTRGILSMRRQHCFAAICSREPFSGVARAVIVGRFHLIAYTIEVGPVIEINKDISEKYTWIHSNKLRPISRSTH